MLVNYITKRSAVLVLYCMNCTIVDAERMPYVLCMYMHVYTCLHSEEKMYASLWEEDQAAKCRREEIEAALQIERNREMLKVLTLQTAAAEKQKEDMKRLKEKEAQLLVIH